LKKRTKKLLFAGGATKVNEPATSKSFLLLFFKKEALSTVSKTVSSTPGQARP
jgi:hypothetical protein